MASLSKSEIEHYVEHLKSFPVEEFGSPAWLQQMMNIEKLNVCAHHQAVNNQFEQVVDAFNTFDKIEVLVHELLAADLWLKNCMKKIEPKLNKMAFARKVMCDRAPTTILNLLELIVYHPENISSEALLPLIDYCNSQMALLVNLDLGDLMAENAPDSLRNTFSVGFSCLSIIWCIASCADISLSVTKRLVSEDDVVTTLCALIMKQPWRTVKKGKVTKWFNGELKQLSPSEAMRVCPPEAHAWTALQQLLEPRCLELTRWNEHRKNTIIEVDSMITEVLIDQLPPIAALKRAIQYLKVNEIPEQKFSAVIEQYPEMLTEFGKKRDWNKIADESFNRYFNPPLPVLQKELMEISELFEIFQ